MEWRYGSNCLCNEFKRVSGGFVAAVIRSEKDCVIANDELSPDEWQELRTLLEILQPFKKGTMLLPGKDTNASLADVIPAYDELLTHLEDQRVC